MKTSLLLLSLLAICFAYSAASSRITGGAPATLGELPFASMPTTSLTTKTKEEVYTCDNPPPFKCPLSSGYFPVYPGACCKAYYICIDFIVMGRYACMTGDLVFDPSDYTVDSCIPEDECKATAICYSSDPFICPQFYGYFPVAPGYCCQKYYFCSDSYPTPKYCPYNDEAFVPSDDYFSETCILKDICTDLIG